MPDSHAGPMLTVALTGRPSTKAPALAKARRTASAASSAPGALLQFAAFLGHRSHDEGKCDASSSVSRVVVGNQKLTMTHCASRIGMARLSGSQER